MPKSCKFQQIFAKIVCSQVFSKYLFDVTTTLSIYYDKTIIIIISFICFTFYYNLPVVFYKFETLKMFENLLFQFLSRKTSEKKEEKILKI